MTCNQDLHVFLVEGFNEDIFILTAITLKNLRTNTLCTDCLDTTLVYITIPDISLTLLPVTNDGCH